MGVVTHARHATNKDQALCPAVGRTLKLSTDREAIDCKRCLKLLQNKTVVYGVDLATKEGDQAAIVVVSKSPGSEALVIEAGTRVTTGEVVLKLMAYAAKANRVRVVRRLMWNAGSDFDSPLDKPRTMQREVVRFNGSESAFRIWMQSNAFDPTVDTAEHVFITTRDPEHTTRWFSKGFTPIDTRSRVVPFYTGLTRDALLNAPPPNPMNPRALSLRMRFVNADEIPVGGSLRASDYVR